MDLKSLLRPLERQLVDLAATGAALELRPVDVLNPGSGWTATLTTRLGFKTIAEGASPYEAFARLLRGEISNPLHRVGP